jgi:hypothetical protein
MLGLPGCRPILSPHTLHTLALRDQLYIRPFSVVLCAALLAKNEAVATRFGLRRRRTKR